MNIPSPPFHPLQFIPPTQEPTILTHPITHLLITAHEPLPRGGNHWCIYLSTTTPTTSIQIDMTPSYTVPGTTNPTGSKGIMIISTQPYTTPPRATKAFRIDIHPGYKVKDLVDLLTSEGRHQYEFTSEGEGCRFWVDQVVELIAEKGWVVDDKQVGDAREGILIKWPAGGRYGLVVGRYYD
ncbi:hypothetical protein BO94DRAFT_590585 [Aspergillus sclerotioniger CBS 115572]|uniref:DUF7770 domain-containing protein n=1 Tax=Aspergillus sclerotioniger CBS 115572 TaxID=1450535 RepID=A0A317V4V2_9EURO|nr:hypothetical protein BO94DRAFT_590585 [Aspergillus sclerotioniger CBS 115572]PWY69006.1 hypothetical protein BO94DRAFT_590585 [Aspergillus sclerotioniger CBS 115572]